VLLLLNDPKILVVLVGTFANAVGAAVALYLWTQRKSDRYLLFWGLNWAFGTLRWVVHVPADSLPWLRIVEVGLLIPVMLFLNSLGSYDLLPTKPWRSRSVVVATAGIVFTYGIVANAAGRPIELAYAFAVLVYVFACACLWRAYRATMLSGHAFAAVTFMAWSVWWTFGLFELGRDVARTVVGPLFNVPLAMSLVIIAYQRRGRELAESEQVLQAIFDTAPTPIVITRPPDGKIERANPVAFEMLNLSSDSALGHTAVEQGVVADAPVRQRLYAELAAGRRVSGSELVIHRKGIERTLLVNADRLQLEAGPRYIFSFHDVTDLRQAERELRSSADEMRQLYTRLATVEDDERRALHTELHDLVGANLAALRLELDIAASLLTRGDAPNTQRHLASAHEVAVETIAMSRNLMAELRPPALDDYGLVAALRTFVASQSVRLSLPIQVTGTDLAPRPSRLVEGALFRIAQEAVINAARHASASAVTVEVAAAEGRVRLTVADDGFGFDPNAPKSGSDHWGLKNMSERARAISGVLRVDSAPGAGTRITADAPGTPS
jgi:PAS domain S-box-containing protein